MRAVAIHQPEYLPWINLFFKMALSDIFVFLDTVQYARRSFQNRNRIKTKNGPRWLTVPLKYTSRNQAIMKMEIDNSQDWKGKHMRLIRDSYNTASHYNRILGYMESLYKHDWANLSELNNHFTRKMSEILGLKSEFIKSSELAPMGKRSELILNICKYLSADRYITGLGTKAYIDEKAFYANGIEIIYVPPAKLVYDQVFPEIGFVAELSIIDYIFVNESRNFKSDLEKHLMYCGIKNYQEEFHG